MEPKSRLNQPHGMFPLLLSVLSIGLLYGRLTVLYAPTTAVAPLEIADKTGFAEKPASMLPFCQEYVLHIYASSIAFLSRMTQRSATNPVLLKKQRFWYSGWCG
ncbi:MAG: hypothetical protein MUC60_12930 [Oscillatoria sp. Prado101]|nr:hypothetical protein [Oscillatoria sp. Prado101]